MIDNFDIEPNRFLSNFYPCFIKWEGIAYPSVEHAYQAAKTTNTDLRLAIAGLVHPGQAKRAGQHLKLRENWDTIKVSIMLELLQQKFKNPELRARLLATGTQHLAEGNDWGDKFWGTVNGEGENMLGTLLMAVREQILQIEQQQAQTC